MLKTLNTRTKRTFALCLALCLILALMSSGASAADAIASAKIQDIVTADGAPTGQFASAAGQAAKEGDLTAFSSYSELFQELHDYGYLMSEPTPTYAPGMVVTSPDTVIVIPQTDGAAAPAAPASEHSITNVRTPGVDEPDMIKTDGRYIYTVDERYGVTIVDAASMKVVKTIVSSRQANTNDQEYFRGIMLSGNKLIIVSEVVYSDSKIAPTSGYYASFYVYDIANPAAPKLSRSARVKGNLGEVRLSGGTLYATVRQYVYSFFRDDKAIAALPVYQDSAVDTVYRPVEPNQIWRVPGERFSAYTSIASFPIGSSGKLSLRCEATNSNFSYMSPNALYLFRNKTVDIGSGRFVSGTGTAVSRYALSSGTPYTGGASFEGRMLNEYAADEYNGNLRVATTDDNGNNLIVFNPSLRQIGSVKGLAKGESVQAVRYMGDVGYVVTYRQVDPLFTLDLSNPSAPRVTGELKIPGFSSYLHPFGTDYLVGLGRETAQLSYVDDSGRTVMTDNVQDIGLKVSLFDVSNPRSPEETAKAIVGGTGSYTPATSNPRAILADEALGLFAFPASIDTEGIEIAPQFVEEDAKTFEGGVIMSVAPPELTVKGYVQATGADYANYYNARFCRVENGLYFLIDNTLTKYDLDTLAELGNLKLR